MRKSEKVEKEREKGIREGERTRSEEQKNISKERREHRRGRRELMSNKSNTTVTYLPFRSLETRITLEYTTLKILGVKPQTSERRQRKRRERTLTTVNIHRLLVCKAHHTTFFGCLLMVPSD